MVFGDVHYAQANFYPEQILNFKSQESGAWVVDGRGREGGGFRLWNVQRCKIFKHFNRTASYSKFISIYQMQSS